MMSTSAPDHPLKDSDAFDVPFDADCTTVPDSGSRKIALWSGKHAATGCPVLLIHSINAAASAYEVRPLFEFFRNRRSVFALELPGFGHSDRSDREYSVRLMTDSIHKATEEIRCKTGAQTVDAVALSLGCEFLARAAFEKPQAFRTLGLISPTGFEKRSPVAIMRRAHPFLHGLLNAVPWSGGLFKLMMRRAVIRKFLEKTWGSHNIDQGLLEYDCRLARQPGAQHAPYYFISGYLFSSDIFEIYQSLVPRVWVAHGTRGDFVDYRRLDEIHRPTWLVEVFDTGAFPHFEKLDEVVNSFQAFCDKQDI